MGSLGQEIASSVLSEKVRDQHIKVTMRFESIPFCSDIFNLLQSQTIPSLTFGQAYRIGTLDDGFRKRHNTHTHTHTHTH
jgi:hypothetical protein